MQKHNNSARPNRKSSGSWQRSTPSGGRGKSTKGGRGRDYSSRGKRDWSSREQWGSEGYRPAGRSRRHDNEAWNEEGRRRFSDEGGDRRESRGNRGGRWNDDNRDRRGGRWDGDNRDRRDGSDRRGGRWDDRRGQSSRQPWRRDEGERERSRGWGRDEAPDARGERRGGQWKTRSGSRPAWKRDDRRDNRSGGRDSYRGGQRRDDRWRDDNDRRGGERRRSYDRDDRYDSRDDRPRSYGYKGERPRGYGRNDERSGSWARNDDFRGSRGGDQRRDRDFDHGSRRDEHSRGWDRGNDRDRRSDDQRGRRFDDRRDRRFDKGPGRDDDRRQAAATEEALVGDEVLDGLTSRMEAAAQEKHRADDQKKPRLQADAQGDTGHMSDERAISDGPDFATGRTDDEQEQTDSVVTDGSPAPEQPPVEGFDATVQGSSPAVTRDDVQSSGAGSTDAASVDTRSTTAQGQDHAEETGASHAGNLSDQQEAGSTPVAAAPDTGRERGKARDEHPHGAVRRDDHDDRVEPVRRQKGRVRFGELGVPAPIVEELDSQGILTPFPIQQAAIPDALSGRDVLGRGQTGSGKTLAFGIPVITRLAADGPRQGTLPRALLMAPTRELAQQVNDVLFPLAKAMGLSTILVAGGMSYTPQLRALERGVDIVVATPGRLIDLIERGSAQLGEVREVVLDEADEMADMGFMPDVTRILDEIPREAQHLLFSATLDRQVDTIVRRYMHDPVEHGVDSGQASVKTMRHELWTVNARDKAAIIAQAANRPGRTLVFVRTQRDADRTAEELREAGLMAGALHGGLPQGMRARVLYAFRQGRVPVLVATDVAARGIDVDDVSLVLQADPPHDAKDYLHRAGRTARAGEDGLVATLVMPRARGRMARIMRDAGVNERPHPMRPGERLEELTGGTEPQDEPVREEQYRAIIAPPRPVRKRGGGYRKGGKPWQRRKSAGHGYKRS